jgi:quercetin dioxygenase-like cupin family protein
MLGKTGVVEMASEQTKPALRPAAGGSIELRLADEIARLKSAPQWTAGDRHAVSLIKDPPLNILLMVLKRGARLHEHRTKGPIAVQVVSGSIRLNAGAEHLLSAGDMAGLDRNVLHSVEALEDSAIVLVTAID